MSAIYYTTTNVCSSATKTCSHGILLSTVESLITIKRPPWPLSSFMLVFQGSCWLVFYRSKSAYTGNKNQQSVRRTGSYFVWPVLNNNKTAQRACMACLCVCVCVCVLHGEGSRVVASNAVSMNHFCHMSHWSEKCLVQPLYFQVHEPWPKTTLLSWPWF